MEIKLISNKNISVMSNYLINVDTSNNVLNILEKIQASDNEDKKELLASEKITLRDNFVPELENYSLYRCIKTMECIVGGPKTPTPQGHFEITNISNEKYISNYYEGGKVCFFGYLEIFEDYFIHSHLYKENATEDDKGKSVSLKDKYTSGCIRVDEDDLKYLLEKIQIDTPIWIY